MGLHSIFLGRGYPMISNCRQAGVIEITLRMVGHALPSRSKVTGLNI